MPARSSQLGYDVLNPPAFSTTVVAPDGPQVIVADNNGHVMQAASGPDTMIGGAGPELFRDGPGADSIVGGSGFDRLSFAFWGGSATEGVIVSLATQTVYDDGHGHMEHFTGIEALGAGTLFPDLFIGDDKANYLWGGAGDVLLGLGGDDVIQVGGAPALVDGGSGVNTLYVMGAHEFSGRPRYRRIARRPRGDRRPVP